MGFLSCLLFFDVMLSLLLVLCLGMDGSVAPGKGPQIPGKDTLPSRDDPHHWTTSFQFFPTSHCGKGEGGRGNGENGGEEEGMDDATIIVHATIAR